MFCRKCGKELPDGVSVCESCENTGASGISFQTPPSAPPGYVDSDSVQKTNGMAIASLVVSIAGLFTGIGIVGIILGIVAQNQIKASRGMQKGTGLAVAGIAVGVVSTFVFIILFMAAALFPVFNKARLKARQSSCMSNVKQLSNAAVMYMQDYDEKLPPAATWSDCITPYTSSSRVFVCPDAPNLRSGYSYYDKLDRVSMQKIVNVSKTPMLFDSQGDWNSALPISQVALRHNGGYNCSFVDGSVRWIGPSGGMP